ncbi:UvrD-helicase domain-containing protein, partial [Paraburkholderia sp. RL17-381-BIF-C]|uniref:UvrD-helicase domain-containing protein n=1 Tax=Paraburkholderia sp. RL17-381-BIF-C TaxID=3031635 RepID=UPI0038B7F236
MSIYVRGRQTEAAKNKTIEETMKAMPQYLAYKDFLPSLKKLYQKGGAFQKAGKTVEAIWGRANAAGAYTHPEVFAGTPTTNHGENRIAHCVKYDLTGFARLVTAYSNDICIFLFAGDHAAVDGWLDGNKGLDFVARENGGALRVDPVFVSDTAVGRHGLIASPTDWMSNGPVLEQLSARYKDKLLSSLDTSSKARVCAIESHTDELEVLDSVEQIDDPELRDALLDVLLALRSSDLTKAKNRIDLLEKTVKPVTVLTASESASIVSGETTVRVQDVDPVLFEHFVRTADFKEWMLYLHPAQREIVSRDFNGPARLAGVSGSGKTCVVIHRALRLARQAPDRRVLILTLNDALARLISELILAEGGSTKPSNIVVRSIFELCREKLLQFNPRKNEYYSKKTVARNGFAISEHIDDIWEEYFHCQNNNMDAEVLQDVARTLLVRQVFPQDYLRQELDYVRSAFSPTERQAYLEMDRIGRVIALERRYRESILKGLVGWEKKMDAVGAIDDVGIVTALYEHLDALVAEYDHVLVDEVQDLGTLELKIIRRLTKAGHNDLFLSGDAAQTVHTKYSDFKTAEIDLPSARWIRLNQNYRNSRQILAAAYTVLTRSFDTIPAGTIDLEITPPEFANFTSSNPLLLSASSVHEELAMAMSYVTDRLGETDIKKACIAICGYSQAAIEELARGLTLPVLCGSTDLSAGALFLSDLDQTKGFEFDVMIVLNCTDRVIPHPELPANESFRELSRLYVALTRAKTELIVSYSGHMSRFVSVAKDDCFNAGSWVEHVHQPKSLSDVHWPAPSLKRLGDISDYAVTGKEFLRMRDAVGFSSQVQDEILSHVTGNLKTQGVSGSGRKQTEWKDFASFYSEMSNPRTRNGVLSDETWQEIKNRIASLMAIDSPTQQRLAPVSTITGTEILLPEGYIGNPSQIEIQLHRSEDILQLSTAALDAHVLAALLVAQQVDGVDKLEVGKPMQREVLDFLVPRRILNEWLSVGGFLGGGAPPPPKPPTPPRAPARAPRAERKKKRVGGGG